jgi:Na+-transporting methylmalonyl-CoA/oxaloacetate decarboxylase gamma subunit
MNTEPIFEPNFLNIEYVFVQITEFFQNVFPFIKEFFTNGKLGAFFVFFFSILLIFVIAWIAYSVIRIGEIQREKENKINKILFAEDTEAENKKNPRWIKVQEHINSNNPAEWRLSIIEADTMLDEMTIQMKIKGDTVAERLKNVDPSDFLNLQSAWEGHKVRNRIAHDGSAYDLTYKIARESVAHFEAVFKEFNYI